MRLLAVDYAIEGYRGRSGGDRGGASKLGGRQRGKEGGHPFLGEREGGYHFVQPGRNKYVNFELFWVLLALRWLKNCSIKPFVTILS
jgi:hypothetical protein